MAKLTSQQRDHFVNRINEQFQTTLGPLEKVAASKKAELVEEKFDEFVESLGIKTILDNLKEYKSWKDIWRETESKLKKRESKLATKYSEYAIDCVLNSFK